jgi:hypothetical protein
MGFKIQIISLLLGLVFLYFVFRFVKRNTFRPSYAFMWILIAIFLVSIPLLEKFYKWVATHVIGIGDARHIIYVVLIGFLLIYIFYITIRISRLNDQIQELISYTAIMQEQMEKDEDEK